MAHAQRFLNNIALAPMTTIGLGGEARLFVQVDSVDQVRSALETAARQGLRWHILGGGSNTIFSDGGFDGLVIKIGMKELRGDSHP